MNRHKIGIFLALLLLVGFSSCKEQNNTSKLLINEILVDNESNFQDDYGLHSGWIEIFNRAYSSADLAGCYLKVSSQPGDTVSYFIPKGDVLTLLKPRQHALFWADGAPRRGTFHTNFVLSKTQANWIGLYDSGEKLLDEVVVPAGMLQANQSYARVSDGTAEWEVKGGSEDKYVTPSTNNQTIESNPKMENFEQHDPAGIGMAISAMSVVFIGLILLYLCFKFVGKLAVKLRKRNAMIAQNVTDKKEAKEKGIVELSDIPTVGEQYGSSHPYADKLSVWQGDITRLHVGAIVNAANSQMLGCFVPCHGCIDNAIHSAAGIELREACSHYMHRRRIQYGSRYEEPTGQAVLTEGYNLPAEYVIHTVGPIVGRGLNQGLRDDLRNCYQNVLKCCVEHKIRSVAFCCISTGEFHFPNDEAAKIAVETVTEFLNEHSADFDRVIFNVFKEVDKLLYEEELTCNN